MEEVLKRNGWRVFSSCSCGGTYEVKFENNRFLNIRIHVRPNAKKWFVKERSRDIASGTASDFNALMFSYGYIADVPNVEA